MMSPIDEKEAHPKKQMFYKFLLLCILLWSYFSYLTFRYDIATGGIASALTWTLLLHAILSAPYPYWSVILLSGAGTFLSILFADELMDVIHNRDRDFLTEDIDRDYEILVALRDGFESKSLGAQLMNGSPDNPNVSVDSAEEALTDLFFTMSYEPQRTAYLGLRDSAQLQLISSPSLRSSLTSYFEVLQPSLLAGIAEFAQSQQSVRVRAGRYVRIFPPERFGTLRLSPDGPSVTKLLVQFFICGKT